MGGEGGWQAYAELLGEVRAWGHRVFKLLHLASVFSLGFLTEPQGCAEQAFLYTMRNGHEKAMQERLIQTVSVLVLDVHSR